MVIPAANRSVKRHNGRHSAVNLLGGLFLISLDVPGRVGANVDVVHIPTQNRVTAVSNFLFKNQFH